MKDLFSDDEGAREDLERSRGLRDELSYISDELELFRHPAWRLFEARLQELIDKDQESLVNCAIEDVPAARARIKAHRHLLGVEAELSRRAAELRSALADPEENDE